VGVTPMIFRPVKKLLPIAAMLAMTATAAATPIPILIGTPIDPLAVADLRVGTTTYDVLFSTRSYDTLFATSAGLLSPQDGAIAAMELATLFDSIPVTGLLRATCGQTNGGSYNGFCDIFIPTGSFCGGLVCSNTVADEAPFATPGEWGVQPRSEFIPDPSATLGRHCISVHECFPQEYAYFKPVRRTVPEPDVTFLIGTGLVLVAVVLRRSKRRHTSG